MWFLRAHSLFSPNCGRISSLSLNMIYHRMSNNIEPWYDFSALFIHARYIFCLSLHYHNTLSPLSLFSPLLPMPRPAVGQVPFAELQAPAVVAARQFLSKGKTQERNPFRHGHWNEYLKLMGFVWLLHDYMMWEQIILLSYIWLDLQNQVPVSLVSTRLSSFALESVNWYPWCVYNFSQDIELLSL